MTQNESTLDRRRFLGSGLAAAGSVLAASCISPAFGAPAANVPSYLRGFEAQYAQDPAAAARAWFAAARCGLFMHYGLYSLLGRGEWAMWWEKIPLTEYEKLTRQFTKAFQANRTKHNEICNTLQDGAWGYDKKSDGRHRTGADARKILAEASAAKCNLLLNTGPLGDGSIHPEDIATLRSLGERPLEFRL